jgi:hypothetical protein
MKVCLSDPPDDRDANRPFGHRRKSDRALIRIVKALPAPLMDGFDVRGFELDRVYEVENPLGHYLIIAGYAIPLNETVHDKPRRRRRTGDGD